jgi:phage terminase large subunit
MELISNLQPKQIKAAEYWLDDITEELLYGGAKGGAKSYLGCNLIFSDALTYPETQYFIARHNLNDLTKFTTTSIYEVFDHWKIDHRDYMRFNGKDNYFHLNNDSRVYYLDCKELPSDPDFHRFGSMQFTRGWIEEAGEVASKAIVNLSASVGRWKNDKYGLKRKLLLTCNPNKGYAYREFFIPHDEGRLPEHRKFVKSLPSDNKYLPPEYIEALNRLPKAERARLMFGDWRYDDDPMKLVEYDKILDMWTNTHVPGGDKYMTVDVARYGADKTVIMIWDGFRVIAIKAILKSDLTHVKDVILDLKQNYHVPMSNIIIDEQGLGGGLVDMLPGCKGFVANRKPVVAVSRKENFDMLKSQCAFRLADWINNGDIFIAVDDYKDEIIEEIEQLKMARDNDRRVGLVSKDNMKDLLRRSPDFQDTMIERMYFPLTEKEPYKAQGKAGLGFF